MEGSLGFTGFELSIDDDFIKKLETADKKILTADERQAIANIENTISTALQDYRSTDDKIVANDLDSAFLDSLRASSGGNQTVYQMSDYEALADKTGMFYVMEIDD